MLNDKTQDFMKQIILSLCLLLAGLQAKAGDGDKFFTANAGFLFRSTLNASLGYEHELTNGNAVELLGEVGNHWQRNPDTNKFDNANFWRGYYWDGGLLYKHRMAKYKNSALRFRLGPLCGANRGDYFFGVEAGLEYNLTFPSGVQLAFIQKNNVNFLHGDRFRNGLMVGLRIPIN